MQTARVVTVAHPALQEALPFKKLVLHKVTPDQQSTEERKATVHELDYLSRAMPVREIHRHNNVFLDTMDVMERIAEVMSAIKPSADVRHKTASLIDVLERIFVAQLELDDLIDVCCEKLQQEGVNWRELPCMSERASLTIQDFQY